MQIKAENWIDSNENFSSVHLKLFVRKFLMHFIANNSVSIPDINSEQSHLKQLFHFTVYL